MIRGARTCVFFDRDGVVNRSPGEGYVLSPEDFVLNPGIPEALSLLRDNGILAVVVTSQKCVRKGLITRDDLARIHGKMTSLLSESGNRFDAVYAHTGDGGEGDYPAKPDPGMILAAAERFGIDLRQSWIVGDADRDIQMGSLAGLGGTIRILGSKPVGAPANHTLNSTMDLAPLLKLILKL